MPAVPTPTITAASASASAARPPLPPEALQRVARQCARRLRYAHFKVQNGWAQQTVDEVETLCIQQAEPAQGDVFGPYASINSGPKALLRSGSLPRAAPLRSSNILGPNQQSRALFGRPAPPSSTSTSTFTPPVASSKPPVPSHTLASPFPFCPTASTPAPAGASASASAGAGARATLLRTPSRPGLGEGSATPLSPSQGTCLAPPWSGPRGSGTPLGDTTNYSTFWSQVAALGSTPLPSHKRPAHAFSTTGSENEQPPTKRRAMGL